MPRKYKGHVGYSAANHSKPLYNYYIHLKVAGEFGVESRTGVIAVLDRLWLSLLKTEFGAQNSSMANRMLLCIM